MTDKILACIQCGAHLTELKCKPKCSRCGYFEDCSDGGADIVIKDLTSIYWKSVRSRFLIIIIENRGGTHLAQETHTEFKDHP